MRLKCIIVDDERLAQNVLEKYIASLESLELIGKCSTAIEAISFLHKHQVDLIFLDIHMPEFSGLEMLKTLENPPKVILTTAYSEYALESYEYGVIDYLLKPIAFDRFLKAVNRAIGISTGSETTFEKGSDKMQTAILLKQDGVVHKVSLDDVLYIEAYGNYLNVFTKVRKFMIREQMHTIFDKLPGHLFVRVHKSYVVSLNKISSIEGNRILINDILIPIGSFYKAEFLKNMNLL